MPKIIVSDTSCLIILSNIGELDILQKVYGIVYTTPEVADEYGFPLPEWVKIQSANDPLRKQILETQVDKGEASAIALALETPDAVIILDDYKARKIAEQLHLNITGTLGILVKAKNQKIIPLIKPVLQKLKNINFRISAEIEKIILAQAGEE